MPPVKKSEFTSEQVMSLYSPEFLKLLYEKKEVFPRWAARSLKLQPGQQELHANLYANFVVFATENELVPCSSTALGKWLFNLALNNGKFYTRRAFANKKVWIGLELRESRLVKKLSEEDLDPWRLKL